MNKLLLPILVLSLVLGSCDVTSLNQNEKGAEDVPAEALFTNAQVALGKHLHDTNVNLGIYKLMAQYFSNTDYPQESQYQLDNRTIPSNVWADLYRDVLADFDRANTMIQDNELLDDEVKQNQLASIEVLEVFTYYMLVTTFGDIPYSEVDFGENTQPAYDDQEEVYADLMDRLDAAIDQFNSGSDGFSSSSDVFYNGNVDSWITFANSLKLRMGITIADVDEGPLAGRGQTAIEEAAPNAMTTNDDNALMPYQGTSPNSNPVWEALVESGRDDFIPSEPLVSRMNNLNDPRREVFFTTTGGDYVGGPYGFQNDYGAYSHFSETVEERTRPGTVLEYAEVEFILAEAAARGYNVSGTAEEHYEAAIRADMEFWGVPSADIDDYLAQPEVDYATASGNFEEKIGTQKWFALFLQGYMGWTEFRRLGFPELEVDNPDDSVVDQVPTRYTYPISEQNFNKTNYDKAAKNIGGDELLTPLFWDKTY
jgi:hypothetical protein